MKAVEILKACGSRAALLLVLITEVSKHLFELALAGALTYGGYCLWHNCDQWYWNVLGVLLMLNIFTVLHGVFCILMTTFFCVVFLIFGPPEN